MIFVFIYYSLFLITGVDVHVNRICGGKPATKDQFPYFVQIHVAINSQGEGYDCGGSLIYPQWVLTAAHCFPYTRKTLIEVAHRGWVIVSMGTNKVFGDDGKWNFAEEVIKHPDFISTVLNPETGEVGRMENDIALIFLRHAYVMTKFVKTIELPSYKDKRCDIGSIIGIGRTSFAVAKNNNVNFAVVRSKDQLDSILPLDYMDRDKVFYTEVEWCKGHALQGDSGGPYICRNGSGFPVLHGVCSAGFNSTVKNRTVIVVYESVSKHLDFISTFTSQKRQRMNRGLGSRYSVTNMCISGLLILIGYIIC